MKKENEKMILLVYSGLRVSNYWSPNSISLSWVRESQTEAWAVPAAYCLSLVYLLGLDHDMFSVTASWSSELLFHTCKLIT